MNLKNSVYILFFTLVTTICFGQMDTYSKKIELKGITDQWHKIVVPNEVFQYVKSDFADIRIYGISPTDTIEAPYILNLSKAEYGNTSIPFKLLNSVNNSDGYFFTYELPSNETINEIKLNFKNLNYNWLTTLEGSQNQEDWFSILEDYRILSIVNDQTDYTFNDLKFPSAKFKYYRLKIKTSDTPFLQSATVLKQAEKVPEYRSYKVNAFKTKQENKNSIVDIKLKNRVAVSFLELTIDDGFEYYRPITIQYLVDSVKTDKGYYHNYKTLARRTLSSLETNSVQLPSTLAQKFRIIISNHDNQPLNISKIQAKGYLHILKTRFTEPANYFLVYGKTSASYPKYDIVNTKNPIPSISSELRFGNEMDISEKQINTSSPLFENHLWLWILLATIILGLGYFTIQMMQKKI